MSGKEHETDKVEDVVKAKDIVLNHLAKQGMVVFSYEIDSIFKKRGIWFVIIDGNTFDGVVMVKSKTGEVVTTVKF